MSENAANRRPGLVELFLWTLAVLLLLYFGVFALLLCDHFVFKDALIEKPLRNLPQPLYENIGIAFRLVYSPLLWLMQRMNIGP